MRYYDEGSSFSELTDDGEVIIGMTTRVGMAQENEINFADVQRVVVVAEPGSAVGPGDEIVMLYWGDGPAEYYVASAPVDGKVTSIVEGFSVEMVRGIADGDAVFAKMRPDDAEAYHEEMTEMAEGGEVLSATAVDAGETF